LFIEPRTLQALKIVSYNFINRNTREQNSKSL